MTTTQRRQQVLERNNCAQYFCLSMRILQRNITIKCFVLASTGDSSGMAPPIIEDTVPTPADTTTPDSSTFVPLPLPPFDDALPPFVVPEIPSAPPATGAGIGAALVSALRELLEDIAADSGNIFSGAAQFVIDTFLSPTQ
eukprot:gene11024-13038_t